MLDYTILSFPHSGLLAAAADEFCAAVFDGGKWASCVERKKGKREGLYVGRAHQSKEGCNLWGLQYHLKLLSILKGSYVLLIRGFIK